MSIFNSSGSPTGAIVSDQAKLTPSIQNVTLTTANTEYSVTIPATSVAFAFRARGCSKVQLAYTATESGTTYVTIWPGETYREEDIKTAASITLYVQSPVAGEILEVWSWT